MSRSKGIEDTLSYQMSEVNDAVEHFKFVLYDYIEMTLLPDFKHMIIKHWHKDDNKSAS
jgi:hypothetical protein